jgi:hypothetical protein
MPTVKQEERQATKYGKLIARNGDNFYILEEIFKYSDDFRGATGTVLRPVPRDEYEERTSTENKEDYYREIWQQAVAHGDTDDGLTDWMQYNDAGNDSDMFDESGSYEYGDQIRALGYSEEAYPVIECTEGGRCFDKFANYDEVYNPELLDKIQAAEQ